MACLSKVIDWSGSIVRGLNWHRLTAVGRFFASVGSLPPEKNPAGGFTGCECFRESRSGPAITSVFSGVEDQATL